MSRNPKDSGSGTFTSPNTNPYLPPEIWAKIFRDLPAHDLLSVTATCLEWKEMLASERTFALLELVLPFLNLNRQAILTCREVSRGAKKSVDNVLETLGTQEQNLTYEHQDSIGERNLKSIIQQISKAYYFPNFFPVVGNSAESFMNRVGENRNRKDNPFLTRSIDIPINFESAATFIAMERMLTLFGHHVWDLTITADSHIHNEDEEDEDNWVRVAISTIKLPRLLQLVPNLKTLRFSSSGPDNMLLVGKVRPNRLPELPNLVTLSFDDWFDDQSLPLAVLRRYGQQITRWNDCVNCSVLQLDVLFVDLLNKMLPNLRKLQVSGAFASALPKLAKVNWPLEELTIESFYEWTTKDFLKIINNFSQTLIRLKIKATVNYPKRWTTNVKPESLFAAISRFFGSSPCKAVPKLQVLSLNMAFTKTDEYNWVWKYAHVMFGHLRELHFDTFSWSDDVRHISEQSVTDIFQKLANLERILHWRNLNGQKLLQDVFTRD
ncbi:unnamed protein product [Orchesella dallaii]|uniref:F-box domain-containing protein n=1 Tax=Orchesella dallaii TaxID=48710 RepID=A0ABP1QRI2_9HEXA